MCFLESLFFCAQNGWPLTGTIDGLEEIQAVHEQTYLRATSKKLQELDELRSKVEHAKELQQKLKASVAQILSHGVLGEPIDSSDDAALAAALDNFNTLNQMSF
eukprot:m.44722 g.44722  ORF g.44722 m.44722 type:complete len:104 (+) comp12124_c1_seq3:86-397(+)